MAGNKGKSQKLKVKSNASRLKLPHILRKITAKALWRWIITLIVVSVLLLQAIRFGQILYQDYYDSQLKVAEKQKLENEVAKWEQVVTLRPNYRDAYFELAVLTYQLDRLSETKKYLAKVFELDPNYQPAREFEKTLSK